MTGYPSIDRPWLKYYPTGAAELPIPAKTAYALVYDKRRGDGGAVANAIDPRLTAGEFARTIRQTASRLLITLDMCLPLVPEVLEQTELEHVVVLAPTESLPLPVRALMALKSGKKAVPDSRVEPWKQFLRRGQTCTGPVDALNVELEKQVNAFFASHGCRHKLSQGYGMTEVSSAACLSTDDRYTEGSVGIPFVKNVIAIFDPDTERELPYGQPGEICIQSPTMMLEYYKRPDATAEVIRRHADGTLWVHTGDIGHMNADGNLFVEGRMKRMIVRSGYKIFPSAVEEVILTHPAVDNCVVVQMPSPTERHVPVAHIILRAGTSPEKTVSEIDERISRSLPAFNVPVLYVLRDAFPLTVINKVDYKKLEEESLRYQETKEHIIRPE